MDPINPDVADAPLSAAEDAIQAVALAFDAFNPAKYETHRAQAIIDLSNAVHDLTTWHSMYDYRTGTLVTLVDEED